MKYREVAEAFHNQVRGCLVILGLVVAAIVGVALLWLTWVHVIPWATRNGLAQEFIARGVLVVGIPVTALIVVMTFVVIIDWLQNWWRLAHEKPPSTYFN
jgi:hypothetical protein